MPYAPALSNSPARITLPAVGAWVWASGSHVCTGTAASFTAKAVKKPSISHIPTPEDTGVPSSCR
jgi:hypothetical protein